MKKTIAKIIFSAILPITLFSSCLGDTENSREATEFVYITSPTSTGVISAVALGAGYITSPEIQKLKPGECYIMHYKVVLDNNGGSGGILNAQDVSASDPIPQTALQNSKPTVNNDSIAPKTLNLSFFYPGTEFGYRSMFSFTASLKQDEKVRAEFYYDKDSQYDNNGPLEDKQNQVVIDVRFVKTNINQDPTAVPKDAAFQAVANLTYLRGFSPTNTEKRLYIKFRYPLYTPATTPAKFSYIGSWASSQNGMYYIDFNTNQ